MKIKYIVLFVLILGISLSAKAHDFLSVNDNGDTIYYNITSSTSPLTVSVTFNNSAGYSNGYTGDISIPDSVFYNNTYYKVTMIDINAFLYCTQLASVNIPLSVTIINNNAFTGCTGLTSVVIPENIISTGFQVFKDCTSLHTVFFNAINCNFMGYIGNYAAFLGCNNLQTIIIGDSVTKIPNSIFVGCNAITSISIPESVLSIGNFAFNNCTGLTSINIPSSVNSIGEGVFSGCSALQSITMSPNIIKISSNTFSGCTSLRSIEIPTNLTYLSDGVFLNCINLDTIYYNAINCIINGNTFSNNVSISAFIIGDSVQRIPDHALQNCIDIENIVIPPSVIAIGNNTFQGCIGLTSVYIPSSIVSIGNYAFQGCTGLTSFRIPSSITSIGNSAFKDCTLLDTVYFNAINCTNMGTSTSTVFSGCNNLKTIIIGDSVTRIPNNAFNNCYQLKSISFNNIISILGNSAFYKCKSLDSIIIPSSVKNIGTSCFAFCDSLKYISLPNSLKSLLEYTFQGCLSLKSIHLPTSLTYLNYSLFSDCILLDSVILPPNLSYIGSLIFENCTNLTHVVFPNNMMNIPSGMFKGCSNLQTINIPSSVISISDFAFMNCTSLTSINLPNSLSSISANLFKNCTALSLITFPNSLSRIFGFAFDSCISLSKIIIPSSVNNIFGFAFKNCYNLDTIIINNPNPPLIDFTTFLNVPNNVFISLPCNSYLNYKNANYWSSFTNFKEFDNCLYSINVLSSDLTSGIVTGSGIYTFDTITITAIPLQNCSFLRWQDGDTNSIRTIIVTKDSNFTAIFKRVVYYNIYDTICQGQTYPFFGNNLTTEGFYSHSIVASQIKDSIINLHLKVNPSYLYDIFDTICQGQTYNQHGFNTNISGLNTLNLQTISGCDSIINLFLTINPAYSDTIYAIICQGEIYSENGFNADSTGLYTLTLQSINGCDSTIYLNLIVNEITKPNNLTIKNITNFIELSWQGEGENYIIYRNNESLAMTATRIFQDSNVVDGVNYCYTIKAINDNCESDVSNQICKTFSDLNTITPNTYNVSLYPNPAMNKTTLKIDGLENDVEVHVYDFTSRIINTYIMCPTQSKLEIDLKNYIKGIYNIKIINSTINITKKLIVY